MGGSNSKQEDKASTARLNKHQRRDPGGGAAQGLDVELLATQCQKTDKTYEQE